MPVRTLAVVLAMLGKSCGSAGEDRLAAIRRAMEALRPLATPMDKPGPSDWLAHHPERGQTFQQYLAADPVGPTKARTTLYIQPLGEFTPAQRKIVSLTAEFMGHCFALPVKVQEDLPLSVVPEEARRVHPSWGVKQILSTYVLDEVLRPRLPKDAVACLAFTPSDLWPGRGWNFVFGQASLRHRVGVWSIYRNGEPERGPAHFRLCLLRTLKTAVHETGHMLSIRHCIRYQCCMNGSNHRAESDRRPLALCPECVAKVWWITGAQPVARTRKLAVFCKEHGLEAEHAFYARCLQALGQ